MLDPNAAYGAEEALSIKQLESAMWQWSEEALQQCDTRVAGRRYTFDVIMHASVDDASVVQKNDDGILMSRPLKILSGRALLLSWLGAMGAALQKKKTWIVH